MYDRLNRRAFNEARLSMVLEPGESTNRNVSAICNQPDVPSHATEGHLTMTDRRLLFYSDEVDATLPPAPVLAYAEIQGIDRHRLPLGTALAIVTMSNGDQWHFVTGRRSAKVMKKLVRRGH